MSQKNIKEAYLQGEKSLQAFYSHSFQNPDYAAMMAQKESSFTHREVLSRALLAQYAGLPEAEASRANIEALANPGTFTVTAGHQLNLMSGPLYLPYKILTAVRLAEHLKTQFPDKDFVPVYWMATEDHDAEEINHYFGDYGEKRSYQGTFTGAVGRHIIEKSLVDLIPEAFRDSWASFFAPGKSYAQGFREFIHHLFGRYGLVIVDGDDPALKGLFRDDVLWELEEQGASTAIKNTSAALEAAGYPAQVFVRDINLFMLGEQRNRIISSEKGFKVGLANFSSEAIQARLQEHPEDFSPNVVMRPLYQERILPNLAYIGGWGELSYWMQLKGMFDTRSLPFPVLFPRMTATLITAEQAASWQELGLENKDLLLPSNEINDKKVAELWDDSSFFDSLSKLEESFTTVSGTIEDLSPPLATAVKAQSAKTQKIFAKVFKKLKKEIRSRNRSTFESIAAVKNAVQPDHKVQERLLNLAQFADGDTHAFLDFLYSNYSPETYQHTCLILPAKKS